METYWDRSDKERAELTADEVKLFLDAELMTKGVLKIDPPILRKVDKLPDFKKVQIYVVKGRQQYGEQDVLGFATMEEAEAFVKLNPLHIESDWHMGRDRHFGRPITELSIELRSFYDYQDLLVNKSLLQKNSESEEANDKATKDP